MTHTDEISTMISWLGLPRVAEGLVVNRYILSMCGAVLPKIVRYLVMAD